MGNQNKMINDFLCAVEELTTSLKENIHDAKSISEKWNCFDKFMIDLENLTASQPMTSRKSFLARDVLSHGCSNTMEGNTHYLKHLSPMPIMVNSVINEDGTLSPTGVSEMHIDNIEGRLCLLITPDIIG